MDEPLVCCICLTRDRPEYLKQAIECFEQQNYPNKWLIIWDSAPFDDDVSHHGEKRYHYSGAEPGPIGKLRNRAIEWAANAYRRDPFVVSHWDDDDWSSPDRLASQVGLLTKNNVKVTGYHDLPFYDVANDRVLFYDSKMTGYAVGTSLMYRREVWERTPFPDQQCGEDAAWQHAVRRDQGVGVVSTTSIVDGRPMMVARHHAGCITEAQEQPRSMLLRQGDNYKPASAELDCAVRYCIRAHLAVL